MTVRVFLVDDHEVVRRGVRELLEASGEVTVVGEADSVATGRDRIAVARPDVAVLDGQLPHGSGIGLWQARQLAQSLNGSLRAENVPAGGAVFVLRLPG